MVAVAAVLVAAALVVVALELSSTQSRARQTLTARFADRARIVSALIQAEISSEVDAAGVTPAYVARTVTRPALDRAVAASRLAYAVVIGANRRVVGASSGLTGAERAQVLSSPALARVLAGAPVALSDVVGAGGPSPVVVLAVPVQTVAGPRVIVGGLPVPLLRAFLGTYLRRVPTPAGAAYVLDSLQNVIGTGRSAAAAGRAVVDPSLRRALRGGTSGPYGAGRYFAADAVPGSTWRVVMTSSQAELFSSVDGSRQWLPWVIFAALGVAAVGFLLVLWRLLRSAAALSAANAELARGNARLRSTNALLRRAAELSRSNAELEQFASIASHDLQEPLRKVQTFAAQLMSTERDGLSPQGQDFLRRMTDAAGRMRSLIDDLLMFSRVSSQGRPFVSVDLGDVVAQVLVDLELPIQESGAAVTVDPMPTVQADPLQMRQLVQNLLGNALKFRRDGVTPTLRVAAVVDDHVAEISVQDNGIGFDEQYATRIFRAFERLHGPRAYPGTGIGLALCRKIVERHHGTITATAQLGHGATFTIRLPVEQPADSAPPDMPADPAAADEVSHALA